MLISGGNIVASYDPLTGEELWTCPGTAESTCGTIIWQDDLVYASGGYPEHHTLCIHAESGEKVWETNVNVYESSMLLANDHLFAVTNSGIAICCNAATGERWWRHRLSGQFSASPVLVNDLIYATSETGTTTVFRADPGSWEELAVNQLGDECFASMAVCDNRIYARVAHRSGSTREEFLYCLGYLSDPGK